MAMKKAAPKKATAKKGDEPVRAGVGKEKETWRKTYESRPGNSKEVSQYYRNYGKALKEAGDKYGFDRSKGPNRNPRVLGKVKFEQDSLTTYTTPKNKPSKNDLAGQRGKTVVSNKFSNVSGFNEQTGSVRGRTAQRAIDQAKRAKAANAKKVAKGKK